MSRSEKDRLITHQHFRVDLDRIKAIINRDLEPLDEAVDRLLDN